VRRGVEVIVESYHQGAPQRLDFRHGRRAARHVRAELAPQPMHHAAAEKRIATRLPLSAAASISLGSRYAHSEPLGACGYLSNDPAELIRVRFLVGIDSIAVSPALKSCDKSRDNALLNVASAASTMSAHKSALFGR